MEHPYGRELHGRRAATHPPLVVAREGLGGVIPSLLAAVPAAVLPSLVWSANPADNGLDCGTVARPAPADTVPPGNRQERSCRLVGRPRRPSRPRAPPPRRQERRGGGGGPAISAPGRQRGAARRAAPDGSGLAVGTVPCRTGPTRTPLPRPPPGTGQWPLVYGAPHPTGRRTWHGGCWRARRQARWGGWGSWLTRPLPCGRWRRRGTVVGFPAPVAASLTITAYVHGWGSCQRWRCRGRRRGWRRQGRRQRWWRWAAASGGGGR